MFQAEFMEISEVVKKHVTDAIASEIVFIIKRRNLQNSINLNRYHNIRLIVNEAYVTAWP